MKLTSLVAVVALIQGAVLIDWYSDPAVVERLTRENSEMRLADNRMTRARTGFRYPKMGATDFIRISACARAVLWPDAPLKAIRQLENGGLHLELGIRRIPLDIRANYPPDMWQYAAGQRIMVQEAGKLILRDPAVFKKFSRQLANRWKARDRAQWEKNFTSITKKNLRRKP